MKTFLLSAFFIFPKFSLAQVLAENQRNVAISDLIAGCSNSLIAPSFKGFIERSKKAGKAYSTEEEAKKAYEQKVAEVQKTERYKNQLAPAATKTCQCILENTFSKIRIAKTQLEIESVIKSLKPDPTISKQCTEKHLSTILTKGSDK